MGKGFAHNTEKSAPVTIVDWEEHAHVGGTEEAPGFKYTYSPPMAYKSFPSTTANYTYHCLAPVGTASSASLWRVFREQKDTGTIEWANSDAQWNKNLIDVTAYVYG